MRLRLRCRLSVQLQDFNGAIAAASEARDVGIVDGGSAEGPGEGRVVRDGWTELLHGFLYEHVDVFGHRLRF